MCLSLDFRMIFEFGRNSQRIPSQDPLRPTALSSWTFCSFRRPGRDPMAPKSDTQPSEMLIHTCNNLHYIRCTSMYSVIGVQQKLKPSLIWGPPPDFCWSVWKHSISCQGCSPQLTDDSQDMICQMLSQVEMLLFHQSEMLPGPADTSSRCRASAVLICLRTWVQWWPTFGPGKPRLFRLCSTEKTWNRCVHPLYLLALEADDRLLIRVSIFSTLGEPDGWKTDHPHFNVL